MYVNGTQYAFTLQVSLTQQHADTRTIGVQENIDVLYKKEASNNKTSELRTEPQLL